MKRSLRISRPGLISIVWPTPPRTGSGCDPRSPSRCAKRISEFRQGCSRLILSDHRPLSDADRRWLVVRCRLWAGKLDKHLAALEAGREPVQVRGEVDETIRDLVRTIRGSLQGSYFTHRS